MKKLLLIPLCFLILSPGLLEAGDRFGIKWDQKKISGAQVVEPAKDVEVVDLSEVDTILGNFSSTNGGIGDMTKSVYDPTAVEGDTFDRANMNGFQIASTVSDFNDAVIHVNLQTNVESHVAGDDTSCKITRNVGDITKYDRAECDYHIQGVEYHLAAAVAVDPGFSIGENHKWIMVNDSGVVVTQDATPSRAQKRTMLVLARIQAKGNQTGTGSDISDLGVLDHRYLMSEEGYRNEDYLDRVFGGLFVDGGLITENVTPLHLDISSGELYSSDRTQQTWGAFTNLSGLNVFHSSTSIVVQEETFVVDQVNWDNGENLTPMTNNNYHCGHTLLMPQRGTQDAEFDRLRVIMVHCDSEHSDLQGAIDAGISYGPFISKAVSGLVPLVQVLVKKNTGIVEIIDYRDRIGAAGGSITSGAVTLQGAYNNSSPGSSEIVLNAAQDGFTISDNATPVGDLFKLNNFANTTSYMRVDPTGAEFNVPFDIIAGDAATAKARVGGMIGWDTTTFSSPADTVENDAIVISVDADVLSTDGKTLRITAFGTTSANTNDKTFKLYFGSSIISNSLAVAFNDRAWRIEADVIRTGVGAQKSIGAWRATAQPDRVAYMAPSEDETGSIDVKITQENGTANAGDCVVEGMFIELLN